MLYVWVIAALVLVSVVVLVALGWGDSAAGAPPDRRFTELPNDRELDAEDVDALRLAQALRGYRMADVDDVLDRLAAELSARDARIHELRARLAEADPPVGHHRDGNEVPANEPGGGRIQQGPTSSGDGSAVPEGTTP